MFVLDEVRFLLTSIDLQVEGDIVELGCNIGTLALFLQRFLIESNSKKSYHVYDSFDGLPDKTEKDKSWSKQNKRGYLKVGPSFLAKSFEIQGMPIPIIHQGWFGEIPDRDYPERISWAFFDGDFHQSITDSFQKVYSKVSPGGKMIVHDYKNPAVINACNEFLIDKPETIVKWNRRMGVVVKI